MHRGVAILAFGLMVSFLLLTLFDREFFLLHFYEASLYLAILLLLFFFHQRWAYMMGILAPAGWLVIAYGMGFLGGGLRQVRRVLVAREPTSGALLLGGVICVLAVAMVALCLYRWRREYSGLPRAWSTFFATLAVVLAYYGGLVVWFFRILAANGHSHGV
jgi:hypothetical protein